MRIVFLIVGKRYRSEGVFTVLSDLAIGLPVPDGSL
jgi:hypothetical protein